MSHQHSKSLGSRKRKSEDSETVTSAEDFHDHQDTGNKSDDKLMIATGPPHQKSKLTSSRKRKEEDSVTATSGKHFLDQQDIAISTSSVIKTEDIAISMSSVIKTEDAETATSDEDFQHQDTGDSSDEELMITTASKSSSSRKIKAEDGETAISADEHQETVDWSDDEFTIVTESSLEGEDSLGEDSNTWFDQPQPREVFKFTGNPGLKKQPPETTPFGFFSLFFNEHFLELLVEKTNDFAQVVILEPTSPHTRITQWSNTTVDELKIFFGIMLFMGLVKVSRLRDYWLTNRLFNLEIKKYMSRDRFLILLRCLHFSSESTVGDPLQKIVPLLNYFNLTMEEVYYPGKNLTIDAWRGFTKIRQCSEGESFNRDVKLYVLTEQNGMVQALGMLRGKERTSQVVEKLLENKTGVGHSVFMGDFINSVSLANNLLEKGCYSGGMLRPSRKDIPRRILEAELDTGEVICAYNQKGVCVCKWNNRKNEVLAVSSEFGGDVIEVNKGRWSGVTKKPEMIVMNNKFMKGVDKTEQTVYHPMINRSLRWYKKLAVQIFQVMFVNSYLLYSMFGNLPKKDLHDFQLEIVERLLPKKEEMPTPKLGRIHLPSFMPHSKGRRMRKRCRLCREKTGKRVDTTFGCQDCPNNPGLCLETCFREFHQYK